MNNKQRFLIVSKKGKIVGTDSCQAFTESAARQKCALLDKAAKSEGFKVMEITPLLGALS